MNSTDVDGGICTHRLTATSFYAKRSLCSSCFCFGSFSSERPPMDERRRRRPSTDPVRPPPIAAAPCLLPLPLWLPGPLGPPPVLSPNTTWTGIRTPSPVLLPDGRGFLTRASARRNNLASSVPDSHGLAIDLKTRGTELLASKQPDVRTRQVFFLASISSQALCKSR